MKIPITIHLSDNWKVDENALIDCGAKGGNFVNSKFAERHSLPLKRLPIEILVLNADRSENKGGKIRRYLKTQIEVAKRTCDVVLLETSLGQEMVILGYPWLEKENPQIDWKDQTITWKNRPYRIRQIGNHDEDLIDLNIDGQDLVIS